MKRHQLMRLIPLAIGALGLGLSQPQPLSAEGDTAAPADEAALAPSPPELDEGTLFFNSGDYAEAVAALAEVQGGPGNAHWLEARWLTGRSFDALGMGQMALMAYADVLRAGPATQGFEQAFNASAALSRHISDDTTFAAAVTDLSAASLPALEQAYGLYVAGNALYEADKLEDSVAFLSSVPRSDPLFAKARLQMAKALIMLEQRPLALAVLQDVSDNARDGLEGIPDGKSLTHLSLARMAYGMGLYEQAADEYARVSRASPYWGDALMERAWAQYAVWQSQDHDTALGASLGALLTLTSPTMENLYYPEAWLLEAQIFFILCKASSGNLLIERFMERHQGLYESLAGALPGAISDPSALYDTVTTHRAGGKTRSDIPLPFLNIFLTDPSFDRMQAHFAHIDREIELIKRQRRAWGGGLGEAFIATLRAHADALKAERGEAIAARLAREATLLQQTLVATELAQLEMLTQQVSLYEGAAYGLLKPPVKKKRRWSLPDDRRVWPFEGEYWKDELGYFQVETQSECGTLQE